MIWTEEACSKRKLELLSLGKTPLRRAWQRLKRPVDKRETLRQGAVISNQALKRRIVKKIRPVVKVGALFFEFNTF
jgi:hypothetical protein